ncbi:hypothetical protein BofuT4_uP062510.1 [Botrytis cinerea T4]|uniref:Uncharacterized protein n=1 Tax=Botryotinia fuckeliana (strain T4) TaxID=999810 RepID=G2XTI5_BOTF4|nr:hypothetical protein BofuT4_uP062510.1 [Botrytis cinerea T4]
MSCRSERKLHRINLTPSFKRDPFAPTMVMRTAFLNGFKHVDPLPFGSVKA